MLQNREESLTTIETHRLQQPDVLLAVLLREVDPVEIFISDFLEPAEEILVALVHDPRFRKVGLVFHDLVGDRGRGEDCVVLVLLFSWILI